MKKSDLLVVGAGLFGSVAAALARERGLSVTVVDAGYINYAASPCSACLFKPSWLSSLSRDEREHAYEVLQELYGIQQVELSVLGGLTSVTLDWVPPQKILRKPDVRGLVTSVKRGEVALSSGEKLRAATVLVASGCSPVEGVRTPEVRSLAGLALRVPGQVRRPSLKVWAPYKQSIAFNISPTTSWFGDGSAILAQNWTPAREVATLERGRAQLGLKRGAAPAGAKKMLGHRPYVVGHPEGYFDRQAPGVFVSNGGAKNGTVLAALNAWRLLRELRP